MFSFALYNDQYYATVRLLVLLISKYLPIYWVFLFNYILYLLILCWYNKVFSKLLETTGIMQTIM